MLNITDAELELGYGAARASRGWADGAPIDSGYAHGLPIDAYRAPNEWHANHPPGLVAKGWLLLMLLRELARPA